MAFIASGTQGAAHFGWGAATPLLNASVSGDNKKWGCERDEDQGGGL